MITDKAVKGLRRWTCPTCGTTLGYVGDDRLSLRERNGIVTIDIVAPVLVERRCSNCGTVSQLRGRIVEVRAEATYANVQQATSSADV
jgi:transposase